MVSRFWTALFVVVLLISGSLHALAAEDAFTATWERTDRPVATGETERTWMWGPEPFTGILTEEYAESPDGEREVRYYDKSRMEITNPEANAGPWYVTNGLLTTELITGALQTGHDTFEQRSPANVNVAGDSDDPTGPTYATFSELLDAPPAAINETIVQRLDRDGNVTLDAGLEGQGIAVALIDEVTDHAIAEPFWEFMNATGPVWEDGQVSEAALFENPYFATGRPITEAYWATIKVAETYKDVLLQCFERRCLTYTPDNPAGWQVEAGNVGRHYHEWRYQQSGPLPNKTYYVTSIEGVETSAGTFDEGVLRGLSFTGTATGDVPGTFRASIDYALADNAILGGTWSISGTNGMVSGNFLGGTLQWDEQAELATITTIMKAVGRSGTYTVLPREVRFDGRLDFSSSPRELSGVLTMYR